MSPMYKPFVSRIDTITKTGDNTMRIVLKTAYVPFETASLSKINIIPKHIWEPILKDLEAKGQNVEKQQEKTPIGSGPFKFVAWKSSPKKSRSKPTPSTSMPPRCGAGCCASSPTQKPCWA